MVFKSKLLRKAGDINPALSPNDKKVIGRLYEIVGGLEVATGLRIVRDFHVDDRYLRRTIQSIRVLTKKIEEELDAFSQS